METRLAARLNTRRPALDLPVAGSPIFASSPLEHRESIMNSIHRTEGAGTVLSITGMTCAGCAGNVARILERVPGVTRAEVDLSSARARVEGSARPADLIAAAQAAGYGAAIIDQSQPLGEGNERTRHSCC